MTPGAISQIENDIITPSLQTLLQLSAVFSKPVDYFIGGTGGGMNNSGYLLSKKGGHRSVPHRHVDMVQIVDTDHYGIKPYYVTLRDDTSVEGPLMLHKGKEFIAVIQGSMKVIIGGDTVTVAEGDTLLVTDAFISRLQKTGDAACRFLYLLL
jgi:mannose-6-phosphate isomerase-like protein (cupin superfamily)